MGSLASSRVFQISSDIFWGYRVKVDLLHFDTLPSVIEYIKNDLSLFLKQKNLLMLIEKLEKRRFHIHNPDISTISDILAYTNNDTIIYVCDHC